MAFKIYIEQDARKEPIQNVQYNFWFSANTLSLQFRFILLVCSIGTVCTLRAIKNFKLVIII